MENWVKAIEFSELKEKHSVTIAISGVNMLLVSINDKVYCIENRCSHEDFALSEGIIDGIEIMCPEHGSRFDLSTGNPLCLPATRPIATYGVKIENGFIYCNLDRGK